MDVRGYSDDDVAALASAIYGEARNQNTIGKAAVAHSALTRANLAGVSVADAVYGSVSKNYGQYSFANPKDRNAKAVSRAPARDPKGWAEAVETARGVLSGAIENPVPGATHYKANYAKAGWAKNAQNLGKVGGHTFYALPAGETAAVVRQAAFSPYRREALVGADAIGTLPQGSPGKEPGTYDAPETLSGDQRAVSIGEFGFSSPRAEKGFARMRPETQFTASEMARTLPSDQDMTITATHGSHGLSNLTHTPGAAFDVRIKDLDQKQLDNLVDSALYSRPASIGYNSGLGKFAAHMHVDTNAGYGKGLQSHSELSGLSDYAKQELARYDAEMKSGLGYTPPVPESIAPVPSPRPVQAITRNPYDLTPKAPEAMLSAGAADFRSPANPDVAADGVPIHRVQSISIKPGGQSPPSLGSMLADASPVGAAKAGTLGAAGASLSFGSPMQIDVVGSGPTLGPSAATSISIPSNPATVSRNPFDTLKSPTSYGPQFTDVSIAKGPRLGVPDASSFPTVEIAKGPRIGAPEFANADIAKGPRIGIPDPSTFATADITKGPRIGALPSLPSSIARNPFDTQMAPTPAEMIGPVQPATISPSPVQTAMIGPVQPQTFSPVASPSVPPLDAPRTVSSLPRVAEAAPRSKAVSEMVSRAPQASASDVWGGKAATGIATDGSTLTRNADGSVSRTSAKTGRTETISKAVDGFSGPSIGSAKVGSFWSGSLPKADVGKSYQGGRQIRSLGDVISGALGGIADNFRTTSFPSRPTATKQNEDRGLSSYGRSVHDSSGQFRDSYNGGRGSGLW